MGKTIVCVRRKQDNDRISIGRPGSTDPATGLPFIDTLDTWKTKNACCEACGEMIGTSNRRYGTNRWPATVEGCTCEICGKAICERCRLGHSTNEVIGQYRKRTEGGHSYMKPYTRVAWMCVPCGKEWWAAHPIPKREVDIWKVFTAIVGDKE